MLNPPNPLDKSHTFWEIIKSWPEKNVNFYFGIKHTNSCNFDPAFHQKKHNITYLYFHSGKPIGFFTPTTGKWVFSCGNRHSKTGFWNLEVPGLYTLPIEFTGHPLKVSLDNDNSLYLFGIALGTKEQKDSPVYWFTEGEKAEHNSLITLQVDNALPPGKVRLLGAYANETSLLALWTSNSSLYSSKIASVDELTPYFGVITDGSQLKLTAIRTSILEGYQAIRDSLEKNTKQALRLKALKNEPRQHPASNLEPWGWIKINGQRLDSVANFFMNSYAGIFYPKFPFVSLRKYFRLASPLGRHWANTRRGYQAGSPRKN